MSETWNAITTDDEMERKLREDGELKVTGYLHEVVRQIISDLDTDQVAEEVAQLSCTFSRMMAATDRSREHGFLVLASTVRMILGMIGAHDQQKAMLTLLSSMIIDMIRIEAYARANMHSAPEMRQ